MYMVAADDVHLIRFRRIPVQHGSGSARVPINVGGSTSGAILTSQNIGGFGNRSSIRDRNVLAAHVIAGEHENSKASNRKLRLPA